MRSPFRTSVIVLAAVLALLLVVGSFWDHAISEVFHDQSNPFGIILAAYGEAPAALALVLSGTLLVLARNRESLPAAIGQVAGGVLLFLLGAAMALFMPGRYLDANAILLAVIGLALIGGTAMFARWLGRDADRRAVIRVALVVFLVVLVEMVLVNIVKVVWDRPRLRFLAENPDLLFQPWFVIGNDSMDALLASGVESEEFKSFPSGHTANAATLMLLAVVAPLKQALAGRRTLLLWIGAAWGLLVGLSRVIVGAHFASDTVVGFSITFALVLLAHRFVQRRQASLPTMETATA